MVKRAVRDVEVPVAAVLSLPRVGEAMEMRVVRDASGGSFDDDVETRLPRVIAGRQRAPRVPRQVDALLLALASTEVEGVVLPYRWKWRHVGATVVSHRRDPEQLRTFE